MKQKNKSAFPPIEKKGTLTCSKSENTDGFIKCQNGHQVF